MTGAALDIIVCIAVNTSKREMRLVEQRNNYIAKIHISEKMVNEKSGTKDVEASLAKIITAVVLFLLVYLVYAAVQKTIDPYGAAAIIGAIFGVNAVIIGILKIRLKRDEEKELLKKDLQVCKNDLRDSKGKVEESQKRISEMDLANSKSLKELEEVKIINDQMKTINEELDRTLLTTKNELDNIKKEHEKTKIELEETGSKLSEAMSQLDELEKKNNDLLKSVELLKTDNQKKEKYINELNVQRDQIRNELNKVEKQLLECSNQIEAIKMRVSTSISTGAHKVEERHFFRTGLNKDSYYFAIRNVGTAPCYRLRGNFTIHRRVGGALQTPIEYPSLTEGQEIPFGPINIPAGTDCIRIDANIIFEDILGNPHNYNDQIPPNRIRVSRK